MIADDAATEIINSGAPPPCIQTSQQCRGCFGWSNMLDAVYADETWRKYPIKCACTGLTLKITALKQ
jgi:hypothetical protein